MYDVLLFTGLCAFLVYLFKFYTSTDGASITGIPGPSLLQLFQQLFRDRANFDVLKMLHSLHNKYGSTFRIHIKAFSPIVVTSDHNYFGKILSSKEYVDKPSHYLLLNGVFGDCLVLTNKTDVWRNDRRILNRAFGPESFKLFLGRLYHKLHELEDIILKKINAPIDMYDVLQFFVLHSSVDSLKDPSIDLEPEITNEFKRSLSLYISTVMKSVLPMTLNLGIFWKMTTNYGTIEREIKTIRKYATDMVDAHLNARENQIDPKNIIISMHKAGIPYDRIVDNVLLFIEGSHGTVATTLACLFFEIAKKPDVQNRICAEVDAIIGTNPSRNISVDDIQQMKYIQCVIKEGLRMHLPIAYIMRRLIKPAIVSNVTLPQGTNIIFNIDALQKSEKYFKNPLEFDPNRFCEENKSNLVPNTWAPFSTGIRNCIGKSLGMQEMTLIVAKIVRRFEFFPVVPEHVLDIRSAFLTRCENGVPVIVKPRLH